jgi:TetR/AcrR family transcriptional regulator, transcriptional repressor of aconitase
MPRRSDEHLQMRRDQIVSAALRCFSREGFHATTMQAVIAESGLSAGAVYRYFPSKNALVVAVAGSVLEVAGEMLRRMTERDPLPTPDEVIGGLLDSVLANVATSEVDVTRVALSVWAEAMRDDELARLAADFYGEIRGAFVRLADRWRETGVLPAGSDPEAVGRVMFSLVPGFVLQRLILGDVTTTQVRDGLRALLSADLPGR